MAERVYREMAVQATREIGDYYSINEAFTMHFFIDAETGLVVAERDQFENWLKRLNG